jgi:hypothetical protein
MGPQVTSRHLRNASELLLFAPIKTGFVRTNDVRVSYVSRLATVLNSLFEPVRAYAERLDIIPSGNVIESLQTIYSVQYTVVERPAQSHLIVAVSFDSSWEAYMQRLMDRVGHLLDVIFSHCEGYDRLCDKGYDQFSKWIYEHQVQCNLFYNATPDLTTDDLRYLRKLSRRDLNPAQPLPPLAREAKDATKPAAATDPRQADRWRVLTTLAQGAFAIREWFQEPDETATFNAAANQLFKAYLVQEGDEVAIAKSLPAPVLQWLRQVLALGNPPPTAKTESLVEAKLANIQGNIIEPYKSPALYGAVVLVQCHSAEAVRKLLSTLKPGVTHAQSPDAEVRVNLALSYGALQRLGLSESTLMLFPKEFREGMEARAGMLGDIGPNAPENWELLQINVQKARLRGPAKLSNVDVVLLLQKAVDDTKCEDDWSWNSHHPLFSDVARLASDLETFGALVFHVQPLRRYPKYDHFEVADGVSESQPVPRAILGAAQPRDLTAGAQDRDLIALGELLLGYEDNHGETALCAKTAPFGEIFEDGTFLVIRKLCQNPERFQLYVDDSAKALKTPHDTVRGLLVGRTPDGSPLAKPEAKDNNFDYAAGDCPLYAHIRRANPRDTDPITGKRRPRIMRRSLPYGPKVKNGAEQGLLFMAYGASIAQQFEVIQRWINGGNSTSILSSQNDLVSGVPQPAGGTYPVAVGSPDPALPTTPHAFVTLRWGMYLFVPSIKAIGLLSGLPPSSERTLSMPGDKAAPSPLVERGKAVLRELDAIRDSDAACAAWKQYIEDPHFADDAAALWAAIRRERKPKRTPYGILVADEQNAKQILSDRGEKFSVREYWSRLYDKLGAHYLTLDPVLGHAAQPNASDNRYEQANKGGPGYVRLAEVPNEYLYKTIKGDDAFKQASQYASNALQAVIKSGCDTVDLRSVAKGVVANLAEDWIGLPDKRANRVDFLEHYIRLSRYAFQPHPESWLEQDARERALTLRAAYARYQSLKELRGLGKMAGDLIEMGDTDIPAIILACAGAIVGFAAPAVAACVGVLGRLVDSGDFARLALARSELQDKDVRDVVLKDLRRSPVPPLLYRRDVSGQLLGTPGDLVVIGLQAVADDAEDLGRTKPSQTVPDRLPWIWLLGGPHGGGKTDKPVHGCPVWDPAVTTIAGFVDGFLAYPNLARNGVMVSLSGRM